MTPRAFPLLTHAVTATLLWVLSCANCLSSGNAVAAPPPLLVIDDGTENHNNKQIVGSESNLLIEETSAEEKKTEELPLTASDDKHENHEWNKTSGSEVMNSQDEFGLVLRARIPWTQKGQSIKIVDPDTWFGTARHVALSPDGLVLVVGYPIRNSNREYEGYKLYTYTYVDLLQRWIPLDVEPLEVDAPGVRSVTFDVDMGARYLVVSQVAKTSITHEQQQSSHDSVLPGEVKVWSLIQTVGGGGRVEVFWTPLPSIKNDDSSSSETKDVEGFGNSVALAEIPGTGSVRVAIGIISVEPHMPGKVHVYINAVKTDRWGSPNWSLVGKPIRGEHASFGSQVKLSNDGSVVAIVGGNIVLDEKSKEADGEKSSSLSTSCLIRIYQYSEESGDWIQLGQDLDGTGRDDNSSIKDKYGNNDNDKHLMCGAMALSFDGMTVAAGLHVHEKAAGYTRSRRMDPTWGHLRVWTFDSGSDEWIQKGVDLDSLLPSPPDTQERLFSNIDYGKRLSLSRNGDRVVFVAREVTPSDMRRRFPKSSFDSSTYLLTFDWDGQEWKQILDEWELDCFPSGLDTTEDGQLLALSSNGQGILETFRFSNRSPCPKRGSCSEKEKNLTVTEDASATSMLLIEERTSTSSSTNQNGVSEETPSTQEGGTPLSSSEKNQDQELLVLSPGDNTNDNSDNSYGDAVEVMDRVQYPANLRVPWRQKGQSIKINDQETWSSTAHHVALSPDGLVLANGYPVLNREMRFSKYRLYTYTYVDRLYQWIPLDKDPIEVELLEGAVVLTEMDMGAKYLVISQTSFLPSKQPSAKFAGEVSVWFLGRRQKKGRSEVGWKPLASIKNDDSANKDMEAFGKSVALAEIPPTGEVRVAVGMGGDAEAQIPGRVHVYTLINDRSELGRWELLGSPVHGEEPSFGSKVKLSEDGSVVAILGSYLENQVWDEETGEDEKSPESVVCLIRVLQYSTESQDWMQLGQDIKGVGPFRNVQQNQNKSSTNQDDNLLCMSLSLSADGMTVASGPHVFGGKSNRNTKGPVGHIRVWTFHSESNQWIQKGADLDSLLPAPVDSQNFFSISYGAHVELSKNGDRIIFVGNEEHQPPDKQLRGRKPDTYLLTFEWDGQQWKQVLDEMVLESMPSEMAMTEDGQSLAIGLPQGADLQGKLNTFRFVGPKMNKKKNQVIKEQPSESLSIP